MSISRHESILHRLSRAQAHYESGMEYVRRGRHESAARSFTSGDQPGP